jgi:PPM family protein phosphatase
MSRDLLHIDLGMKTDVGRVRDHNEDSIRTYHADQYATKGGRLFIVADGVGGEAYGEVASEMAAKLTGEQYYRLMSENNDLPEAQALRRVLSQVNRDIYKEAGRMGAGGHMATTIVAAVLHGNQLSVGWVGDSRAYLIAPEQEIQQITRDHTLVEELFRKGELTAAEAKVHPRRNVLSRSMGGQHEVLVDVVQGEVYPGFLLVICSDGLTRHLTDAEISNGVTTRPDLMKAAERLVHTANIRGGKDNISVIVVRFGKFEDIVDGDTDVNFVMSGQEVPRRLNREVSRNLLSKVVPSRQLLMAIMLLIALLLALLIIAQLLDGDDQLVAGDPPYQTVQAALGMRSDSPEMTEEIALVLVPSPIERTAPPEDWVAGKVLFVQEPVGLSSDIWQTADSIDLLPGMQVTLGRSDVGEGEFREWYEHPERGRWWFVRRAPGEGPMSGWVPEHVLGETWSS